MQGSVTRRDVIWAIAIALLTGTLFLVTLRPDVGGTEDSPKFQFLGQVLGTAHTPGYPFYTIATYVFTRVPLGTLAYRVNLFSAVCGVFSCVCIFLLARRLNVSRLLAAAAAFAAATGFPLWSNSVTAEVYSLAALMSAWTIYLLIAWMQTGRIWRLYAACAVFAAGLGNHLTIVGLLPAALLYGIVKDRSVLKLRVLGICAVIGVLGVAQYGFIALRTIQGAPYLEARATTIKGVYDVIIARDVSWARFYQAADKVVGIEVPMLLEGVQVHMGTISIALVILAIGIGLWRRRADVLLIAGGAAGTLAMIANLWGDVVGFLTPVVVLLWPLAAFGLQTLATVLSGPPSPKRSQGLLGLRRIVPFAGAVAMLLPLWNIYTIHPAIERLRIPGDGPGLRALYSHLPPDSALVAHNYFIARILNYLHYSNEYDPDPNPRLLNNDADAVRGAAAEGRSVFALDAAVPWLTSQGLVFEPSGLSRQPLGSWVQEQPDGTTVMMASAATFAPLGIFWDGHPPFGNAGPTNFTASIWTKGRGEPRIEEGDTALSIRQDLGGRMLDIASDDAGPRMMWGDDVLSAIDRGVAVVVINPQGRVVGRWAFALEQLASAQLSPTSYLLRGEVPCETLRTMQRVDVSKVLGDGGWYATVDGRGMAEITIEAAPPATEWRQRMTNGRGEASIDTAKSRVILNPAPGTRAVFRLSMPRPRTPVTATLESSDHAVRVCQVPITAWPATGALDVGLDHDERFDSGWHQAEHAGTQQFRWSTTTSTMSWRVEQPADLRLLLRLRAAHMDGTTIRASLNGVELTSCSLPPGAWTDCRLDAPASALRNGLNDLRLSSDTVAPDRPGDPRELAFVMQNGRVRFGK